MNSICTLLLALSVATPVQEALPTKMYTLKAETLKPQYVSVKSENQEFQYLVNYEMEPKQELYDI